MLLFYNAIFIRAFFTRKLNKNNVKVQLKKKKLSAFFIKVPIIKIIICLNILSNKCAFYYIIILTTFYGNIKYYAIINIFMTYKYNNIFISDLKKLIIVTCTSSILFVYIMSYICSTFIICFKNEHYNFV